MPGNSERLLIASIGTTNYHEQTYQLGALTCTTRFSPVAVARLLRLEGARAGILVTPEAHEKWFDTLGQELEAAGLRPEPIPIPKGATEDELWEVFAALVNFVPPRASVVLDVTFALRHLPFVYFASLSFLTALREVTLQGVHYAAAEMGRPGQAPPPRPAPDAAPAASHAPLLDLSALMWLGDWYQALRSAREARDFRPIARRLEEHAPHLFPNSDKLAATVALRSHDLARALAEGLPLEAGLAAARFLAPAGELLSMPSKPPTPAAYALEELVKAAQQLSIPLAKRDIVLDTQELRRELELVQGYLDGQEPSKALLLLREWLVSFALYRGGEARRWLVRNVREEAERRLGGRGKAGRDAEADPLHALWKDVSASRNAAAHLGFTTSKVQPQHQRAKAFLQRCQELLDNTGLVVASQGEPRVTCLLVTPLGLSPGVLFSAVRHVAPSHALVITSARARPLVVPALEAAEQAALPHTLIELADPHFGFREARERAQGDEAGELLAASGKVVVNLTGGTTALQYAAEAVAARAEALGSAVRRAALIDRRSPEQQRAEPYVLGEIAWLDADAGTG